MCLLHIHETYFHTSTPARIIQTSENNVSVCARMPIARAHKNRNHIYAHSLFPYMTTLVVGCSASSVESLHFSNSVPRIAVPESIYELNHFFFFVCCLSLLRCCWTQRELQNRTHKIQNWNREKIGQEFQSWNILRYLILMFLWLTEEETKGPPRCCLPQHIMTIDLWLIGIRWTSTPMRIRCIVQLRKKCPNINLKRKMPRLSFECRAHFFFLLSTKIMKNEIDNSRCHEA